MANRAVLPIDPNDLLQFAEPFRTPAAPIDSCLQFAERVGLQRAAEGANFVFSPVSIRAALSLAAAGSGGETLQQMMSFLGSPTLEDLNSSVTALLGSLTDLAPAPASSSVCCRRLSFVNGVWVEQLMALKPSFQEIATSLYGAVVKPVDFLNNAPAAAEEVKRFIEEATNGLIKQLISRQSVSSQTRIIIANALYFRGMWADKFNQSETRSEEFHLLDGSKIKVPFMTSRSEQYISTFGGFKVLRLPYQSIQQRSFSMLIFLPTTRDGLASLIRKATSEPNFMSRHFPDRLVRVDEFMIPKFKISSKFEAREVLRGLGLDIPFDQARADFSQMVVDTTERLHVSGVFHKATIEVEEEGTVAAAATVLLAMPVSCSSVRPVDFKADHPFMFAIREEVSGAVLFLGHVANPSLE